MPEDEKTTDSTQETQSQASQTDTSSSQSTDVTEKSVQDMIGEDLLGTIAKPPAKPEVGTQETAESEETTEEVPEDSTAESESQVEVESDEEATQVTAEAKEQKPNVVKHLRKVIKDKASESKAKDAEIEQLRSELLSRVNTPVVPVERTKDRTPEYWAAQYTANQQQGIPDTDPRQAAIVAKYQELDEEVKFERFEQRQNQKAASQRASTAFVNSLVEIHEMNPFLVKNEKSAFGVDVDYSSTLGQKMKELSQKEGVALNNAQAVIHYAQRANAIVLHQRLTGENQNATTLKRQLAEGQAKGTITSGTRRAPPAPKGDDAKLKSLTQRANSGKKNDREALAAAALAADLGM